MRTILGTYGLSCQLLLLRRNPLRKKMFDIKIGSKSSKVAFAKDNIHSWFYEDMLSS